MGKIVDEVFDGAIEDSSVIEEIYACIKRHEAALSTDAEPVAARFNFDGYGFQYIDNGSGSDWKTRKPDAELLYDRPQLPAPSVAVKALEALLSAVKSSVKVKAGPHRVILKDGTAVTGEIADRWLEFMHLIQEVCENALSAQVQDVAEYEYRLLTAEGREYARLSAKTDDEAHKINDGNFAGRLTVQRRVVPEWEVVAAPAAKLEGKP
ncbi:hypothetical protein A6R70_14695 [Agrobacterium rubi]|nr:hypothetical protein [Agrobacterium rubi]